LSVARLDQQPDTIQDLVYAIQGERAYLFNQIPFIHSKYLRNIDYALQCFTNVNTF